jgi:DNA-directed RNA polymerase I subunit RPA1
MQGMGIALKTSFLIRDVFYGFPGTCWAATAGVNLRGTCMAQDHVVAGVRLTKRDTFLSRAEFMQLVYAACAPPRPGLTDRADLAIPPPAILKPQPLWTGKQAR